MSETFEFDVFYDTSFEKVEELREKMLAFVKSEGRDFLPSFDIIVKDIPEQLKMTLSADIQYKSNWQQGATKGMAMYSSTKCCSFMLYPAKRRNKWICALKTSLAELEIFGPEGNPNEEPVPKQYTQVPWEEVRRQEEVRRRKENVRRTPSMINSKSEYNLFDRTAAAGESFCLFKFA
jgi:small-conductance mechanosensitive channel